MQVILLERVQNLGQIGDTVEVKPGYARNFLLPRKKALRATQDNIAYFETQKKHIEADNLKKKKEAETVAKKIDGLTVTIVRQAAESGKLYGSVSSRDAAEAITASGTTIARQQVELNTSIKLLGLYTAQVKLHPEVIVEVTLNVARSEEEAKIQLERGAALIEDPNAPVETAPAEIDVDAAIAGVFEDKEAAKAELTEDATADTQDEKAPTADTETAEETKEEAAS